MIASSFNLLLLFSLFLFDLSNSEDVTVYLNDTEVVYSDFSSSGPSFASLTTYPEFQSFSVTIPIGVALELGWCHRRRRRLEALAYISHLQGGQLYSTPLP